MSPVVYFLPGQGGRLTGRLGGNLSARGFKVVGRETVEEFRGLSFQDKIEIISRDLREHFWHEEACVVANSFGGYLFLHAQTLLEPYVGRVLLLSPIVGQFDNKESWMSFIPPHAERLIQLASAGNFPAPRHCEIHVGENDWQSIPDNVTAFADLTGLRACVVPDLGHELGKEYVDSVLDRWLPVA